MKSHDTPTSHEGRNDAGQKHKRTMGNEKLVLIVMWVAAFALLAAVICAVVYTGTRLGFWA